MGTGKCNEAERHAGKVVTAITRRRMIVAIAGRMKRLQLKGAGRLDCRGENTSHVTPSQPVSENEPEQFYFHILNSNFFFTKKEAKWNEPKTELRFL